jgi:hypothetical protein
MSGTDEAGRDQSVELRSAIPDITVTPDAPDVLESPAEGTHRRARWRHAFAIHGWGLPAVRQWPGVALAWSRRPSGRLAVPGLVTLALVVLTGAAGLYLVPASARSGQPAAEAAPSSVGPSTTAPLPPIPEATFAPPPNNPVTNGRPADAFRAWAQEMATRTDVPAVAVQAYGYAEWVMSQQLPACKLAWPTLAAIGKVESNHGRANSATLTEEGRAYPPIFGPALDGQGGRELIRDTDGGALDRDTAYDRAVGPMQFIPGTWKQYEVDADDDFQRDPHDIDDAALAAAKLLCAGGRDLTTAAGWWGAVLSYNEVRPYADAVYTAANDYGQRSRNGP